MYRQYEDPRRLEQELRQLLERYYETDDDDEQMNLSYEITELKDRIRFAWDDDENG